MNDIRLINLSSYVRPDVDEQKGKGYVLNGRNNSFYTYIIDRNNGSATNNSINQSYSTLMYGKGLATNSGKFGAADWARLQTILKPRELRKIVTDYQIFGEFSFQVIENRGGELDSIVHLPKQMIVPSIANDNNEIEFYYMSKDWSNIRKKGNEPTQLPAFQKGKGNSIYVGKPYRVGCEYFGSPDYIAGLQYMEAEEEVSNLTMSSIKNGLSAGYIINIPDGINYTAEEKSEFEKQVKRKLTQSSNASNFIVSFNGSEAAIDVTPLPVNDNIHKQWNFLTEEAKKQIMTSHRVVSPSLVGLDSASGFSSQADMIDESEKQLMKRVIAPKQNFIIECLEEVLMQYGFSLSLLFKPLTQEEEVEEEVKEVEEKLAHVCCSKNHDIDDKMISMIQELAQDPPADYDLTDGSEYDTVQLSANQTSEQDTDLWKTRYAYTKGTSKNPKGGSRTFCVQMLAQSAAGKVFRKEDIDLMSSQGMNGQFAKAGESSYDIFKYGGGVGCHHRFERRVYKKKLNKDGTPKKGGAMASTVEKNVNQAKREGYKAPVNHRDVAIAEIDKPNKGSLKNKKK